MKEEEENIPAPRVTVGEPVCPSAHICFGFDRFVCPSVFVLLPPPSSPTPSVSRGRLRNDQSGFDAPGPWPVSPQPMRPGNQESLLNQSCVTLLLGAGGRLT